MEKHEIVLAEDSALGQAGQRVTLALQPADVHDPTELATYLAGYSPFGYRADEASKVVLVDNDQDKYRTFNRDDAFRAVNVKAGSQGSIPEVDPKSSLSTYTVVNRYVGSFIPRQTELQTGNNYNPRMRAGERCRRALDLDREIDVWTMLETNTNFASAQRTALTSGYQWNGGSNADPIKDLQTQIENSDQPVSTIWMNQKVANNFLRNDTVRDHMRQMIGDNAASSAATQVHKSGEVNVDFVIPGLPPIRVVASKVKNESTSALNYILNDVVVLVSVPPGVPTDGDQIATTYTFRRKGPSGVGITTREFFVDGRGPEGGTMVAVSMADIHLMTGNNCGGIITNVIQ
jgi:hypothetical protein